MKTSRAFTLIELLVVIAIIGVLMSLLFPAANAVIDTAKKTQAKNDATQIVNAINAYNLEYAKLPSSNEADLTDDVGGDMLDALIGSNEDLNPRGIIFIETSAYKKGKGGVEGGVWKDPWGTAYRVALDLDYNNKVSVSTNGESTGGVEIVKKVAIWNVTTTNKRQIRSWD